MPNEQGNTGGHGDTSATKVELTVSTEQKEANSPDPPIAGDPCSSTSRQEPDEAAIKALLELVRARTARLEKSYYQQEARAQFVTGITIAVSASLLPAFLQSRSFPFLVLGGGPLLLTFFLASTAFMPLIGRKFAHWDSLLTWLGFLDSGYAEYKEYFNKPKAEDQLIAFAERRYFNGMGHALQRLPDTIRGSELYLLWAQWFVTERKAGILRWTNRVLLVALLCAGVAYYFMKTASQSSTSAAPATAPPSASEASLPLPLPQPAAASLAQTFAVASGSGASLPLPQPIAIPSAQASAAVSPPASASPAPSASVPTP